MTCKLQCRERVSTTVGGACGNHRNNFRLFPCRIFSQGNSDTHYRKPEFPLAVPGDAEHSIVCSETINIGRKPRPTHMPPTSELLPRAPAFNTQCGAAEQHGDQTVVCIVCRLNKFDSRTQATGTSRLVGALAPPLAPSCLSRCHACSSC